MGPNRPVRLSNDNSGLSGRPDSAHIGIAKPSAGTLLTQRYPGGGRGRDTIERATFS